MTTHEALQFHQKSRIALYYWMLGKGFIRSCEALNYAEKLHTGLRKDNITPEFTHQIWIANFLRTLPLNDSVMEMVLTAAFLHDTREDKAVSDDEIKNRFGHETSDHVDRLTKKFRGVHVDTDVYFTRLSENLVASLVKGVDRLHNISSMVGVFTVAKQKAYIEETEQRHLPMLKIARKNFPHCEAAFENIKLSLESRISLIKEMRPTLEKNAN